LSHVDKAKNDKELTKLKDKILRFKEKYDVILNKEKELNKPVIHVSKYTFI